jgi:predicted dehydrogenase/nucleoside-diphosphate-sugar epimerase
MSRPIKLGVVGCGAVLRKCHLPALRELPDVTIAALVDNNIERALEMAEIVAGDSSGHRPMSADSLDSVLENIDAALICTSNSTHASIAASLLRAGKHVLVEKPLATTASDCEMLCKLQSEYGTVLAVGHVRRFFPTAVWMRDLLAAGTLGRPRKVLWQEGEPFAWPTVTAAMFRSELAGGGVVLDVGVHVFDLLMSWFGDEAVVTGYVDDWAGGLEADALVRLKIGDVDAEVCLSRRRSLGAYCEVTGSGGVLRVDLGIPANYEIRSLAGQILQSGTVPTLSPAEGSWRGVYVAQLRSFFDAIRRDQAPVADAQAGRRTIELTRQCYAAPGRGKADHSWVPWTAPAADLASRHVAVTGATGFLGTRLVEALLSATDATVLAAVRNYSRLPALSRLDQARLRFAAVDLDTTADLDVSLRGTDTVIHCAFGGSGTDSERWRTTVDGTRAVIKASLKAEVKRLVYVSSIAVYDTSSAVVTEDSAVLLPDDSDLGYGQQKLCAERLSLAASESGLEVVVIQPAVIYGPWGPRWTINALRRLASEPGLLPSGSGGVCNAVYVDDVVSALLLAAAVPGAAGERFIVSGPSPVSWGEFYDRYRDILSVPRSSAAIATLPEWERTIYAENVTVSTDRAREILGYHPVFGLDQGMARVRAWAQWYGLASRR